MKLSMVSIEKGGLILVAAEGNITAADYDPVAGVNPLQTLLGVTWSSNRVLLDLGRTQYVDSSAIGWLMNCHKAFREAGGQLVIYNVQPTVRQLLDVLKIGRVLPITENEAAARDAVAAAGGAK